MNQARSAVWCRAGISNIGIRGDDVLCRLRSELGPARPPGHPGPGSKGVRHRAERDTLPHCHSETTVSHLIQTKTCCDFNTYTISVAKVTLEVQMSVCTSVSLVQKPPNSLKSIISPYYYLHHHSHHQKHHHPISHTTSPHNIMHHKQHQTHHQTHHHHTYTITHTTLHLSDF